jgi:hypothetical protein
MRVALIALVFFLTSSVPSVGASIQLVRVASGLSSPLFVTHAHDGTNRLFILERGGIMKVLQPGASTPTVFLDIQTKVLSGGERGLLGLAFHPQYPVNPRFYLDYTRAGDGATVIAEYQVSSDPNAANPTEKVLLVIEGTSCTALSPDPTCSGSGYTFPVIEYAHALGRCSITGGYVYRGTQGSLPVGSYVFG